VLDPFCGVGTTIVEVARRGVDGVGFEVNPFAAAVVRLKIRAAKINLKTLIATIGAYLKGMSATERKIDGGWDSGSKKHWPKPRSSAPQFNGRLPLFSAPVECKLLHTLDFIETITDTNCREVFRVALGAVMVPLSNYHYAPSLTPRWNGNLPKRFPNASVKDSMEKKLIEIVEDIVAMRIELASLRTTPNSKVFNEDFLTRKPSRELPASSVDLVITSPPYLNNYHYVRNTRPQLVWLYGMTPANGLKRLESENFGQYWQTVRGRPAEELLVRHGSLERQLKKIRALKREGDKNWGVGWANYVVSYFNDSSRLFDQLKWLLKPRASAVIVVGNSFIQGHEIRVEQVLADIAREKGFKVTQNRILRDKRVGTSILNSHIRNNHKETKRSLYEAGLVIQKR
jgi:DNA modification methylase